jgi:hypothetical protein
MGIKIGATDDGRPYLQVEESEIEFSKLDLVITGSTLGHLANWVFDLVRDIALSSITSYMNEALVSSANKVLDELTVNLPTVLPIGETPFAINYALQKKPFVYRDRIEFPSRGEVIDMQHQSTERPIGEPVELPAYNAEGQ